MSTIVTNPDAILSVCEEVMQKTSNMHHVLKNNYIVITDSGCANAYDYFIAPFETERYIAEKIKNDNYKTTSDVMYNVIYKDYKIRMIVKINSGKNGIVPTPIYTSKENGERLFIFDRDNKTVTKPSTATYVDTPFDLMLTIIMNGMRSLLELLNYVTYSEIMEYANNHYTDDGRDGDIAKKIYEIIGEIKHNEV